MKNCLIFDETNQLKSQLSLYLNKKGFSIGQAIDCHSGLEYCRDNMPDVILLGSGTPRKSVQCFLNRLEKRLSLHSPVIIYCAKDRNQKSVDEAIIDGATDYLVMPFDYDLFSFKLRQSGLAS